MSEDERLPVLDARSALEALIFASDGPATATDIRRALPEIAPARIPDLIEDINEQLEKSFVEDYAASGKKLDMGKSCVRFKRLDDLPLDVIGKTIAATSVPELVRVYQESRERR